MSKIHTLWLTGFLLAVSACGTAVNTVPPEEQVLDYNFTLQDAIDVYACAYGKETDAAEKEKLQLGLYLHRLYEGDEVRFKREADPDRARRHQQLNGIAVKYNCAPEV